MIDFTESHNLSLGNSGSGPYKCTGYCYFGDYLILSLYEAVAQKCQLMAVSISSSGVMTVVTTVDVMGGSSTAVLNAGGVFSDGVYIYNSVELDDLNPYVTMAWTFNGTSFVYPPISTSGIYAGHREMCFGAGYVFAPSPDEYCVYALFFNGSTWYHTYSTDQISSGMPLNFRNSSLWGVESLYGGYYIRRLAMWFDPDRGFYDVRHSDASYVSPVPPDYANPRYRLFIDESPAWNLWQDFIQDWDSTYDYKNVLHTYSPVLPDGLPYHSSDNILTICTVDGLHYYESVGAYRHFGVYRSGSEFYFYFKFKRYEFFMNDEVISGEYYIRSGKFFYAPEFNINFYPSRRIGTTPITVNFTDLTN